MGIPSQLARIILREHRHRPIRGRLLSIARQTIYLSPQQAIRLAEAELAETPRLMASCHDLDLRTRGSQHRELMTDRSFYSLFSDAEYNCLDISDYEGANIIANLCEPLPPELEGQFDFIVNGSCLDNIFDPATALRNMTLLLRHGGRVLHFERASRVHHAYVAFALSWFHDYYALNDFDDCQAYLVQWDDLINGRWDLYHYRPVSTAGTNAQYFGQDQFYYPYRDGHALVIAEKSVRSTWNKCPVQYQYRAQVTTIESTGEVAPQIFGPDQRDPYVLSAIRFHNTSRSPLVAEDEKVTLPDHLLHYAPGVPYRGSILPVEPAAGQ